MPLPAFIGYFSGDEKFRFEWLFVAIVLLGALWPLRTKLRSPGICAALLLLLGLTAAGAKLYQRTVDRKIESRRQLLAHAPTEGRPDGYVSSTTCRACHPDQYASWHRSYHRTMTQYATPESVRGPFENVTLTLANERYVLERRGDEFWVEMTDPDWRAAQMRGQGRRGEAAIVPDADPPRTFKRVGMLTGSHFMQAYWVSSRTGNEQFNFPFTYLFEAGRWVPRNDVFLLPPEAGHMQQVWNLNCINCHATAGQPLQDEQTQITASRVAELGIACEACHGPAAEHIRTHGSPLERYRRHAGKQPDPTIFNPARQNHEKASEMCSQ